MVFNNDVHFSYLIWNGGLVTSPAGVTMYLDKGNHIITGAYSGSAYPVSLDTTSLINNGAVDMTGSPNLQTVNGGQFINNLNVTANVGTFENIPPAIFTNNHYFIVTGDMNGNITNNGTLLSPLGSAGYANDIRFTGSIIFTASSVVQLNLYANAEDYGGIDENYDQIEFFNAVYCRFGGELLLNFVQPARVVGQPITTYTPTSGELYPLISMPEESSGIGGCDCQFASIKTIGLSTSLAVGIQYDVSAGDYQATLADIAVCASGDTSCTSLKRSNAPCSSSLSSTATIAANVFVGKLLVLFVVLLML